MGRDRDCGRAPLGEARLMEGIVGLVIVVLVVLFVLGRLR